MLKQIEQFLINLRDDINKIDSDLSLKNTIEKYDMLLLGDKFNTINSIEFIHSLNYVSDIDVTNDELVKMLPELAHNLNFNYDYLIVYNDKNKDNPDIKGFFIYL